MDRRDFLRLMAATGAGAAAGCNSRSSEKLLPYLEKPEEMVPGVSRYYATTSVEDPDGAGLLARTREGRVVKLEGNPAHPLTQGALNARGQAALQGLYNPDRISKPLLRDTDGNLKPASWEEAEIALSTMMTTPEKVAWISGHTADSDVELIEDFSEKAGFRTPMNLRLYNQQPLAKACFNVFGNMIVPEFKFDQASLIVSLNADFLETWGNPISQTVAYTKMHANGENKAGRSIYIGSRLSNTAASCDKWIQMKPGLESSALLVIARSVMDNVSQIDSMEFSKADILLENETVAAAEAAVGVLKDKLVEVGKKLAASPAPLVIASGYGEDAELAHSLAILITHVAGGSNKTLFLPEKPIKIKGDSFSAVRGLVKDFAAGIVDTLLIHEANPVFLCAEAHDLLSSGENLVYLGTQMDETAKLAKLVLPTHHFLESWGYQYSSSSVLGCIQPVMKSLFNSKSLGEIIFSQAEKAGIAYKWTSDRDYVESRLLELAIEFSSSDIPKTVREIKRKGGLWNDATYNIPVKIGLQASLPRYAEPETGLTAHFFPHPYLYDGTGADKSWLQEVPDTVTSVAWGSWAELHVETAAELGIKHGDIIKVSSDGRSIELPAFVWETGPVMKGVVAVPIGQGHEAMGRYAAGVGANPLKLCRLAYGGINMAHSGFEVKIEKVRNGNGELLTMAGSQDQGERELAQAIKVPKDEHDEKKHGHHFDEEMTFYPKNEYELYDWGLSIDLDACTGCGSCVVACYAENNLGVVGKDLMAQGREMSWIRIERYVEGDDARILVNMCQQCHHAPCEPVCPVQASYHNDEGLNAQVYNRCVGTRYCSNNCPYKVRRFNWFDYEYPAPLHLQLNPDVSVRERGVMEKCTFCVQRIKEAKETAKNEGRTLRDGEVQTACQQTCPAKAITFGNLLDENSSVSKIAHDKRSYRLLEELGTRPSVHYLKKVIRKDV